MTNRTRTVCRLPALLLAGSALASPVWAQDVDRDAVSVDAPQVARNESVMSGSGSAISAMQVSTGQITGAVLDPATGDYLRNAIIKIDGRQVATSGERGEFRINDAPSGAVQLSVEYTGYAPLSVTVNVRHGTVTRQDIELRSSRASSELRADTTEVGEVVVVGAREGDARAIMEQRASMNIVNTLSADSFGEIGDGNPAEFLKYMPGVDFDVVADDVPRNISLRGLPARYTGITINGRSLAGGADANTSTTSPTSRQYSFEQLALTGIDTISVSKTTSADMDANAPAGTIDIRTRKAFDRRGRSIIVQLGASTHTGLWDGYNTGWQEGGYGDKKFLPMGQITYADVFLDGRLGVTAGLSDSTSLIEHIQTTAGRNYIPTALSPDPYAVTTIGAAFYDREYNRKSATLGLDFKATDRLVLSLIATYNRGDIEPSTFTPTFTTSARTRGVVGNGDPALDFTTNALATATTLSLVNSFTYKVGETNSIVPSFEWSGDRVRMDGYLAYSDSSSRYDSAARGQVSTLLNTVDTRGNFSAVRSNLLDQDWKIQQISGPDWSDPASYVLGTVNGSNRPQIRTTSGSSIETDMVGGGLNLEFDGSLAGVPVTWKSGVKFTRNGYDYANNSDALQWTYNGPLTNTEFLRAVQSANEISFANSGMNVRTLNGGGLYVFSLSKIYDMMQADPGQWTNTISATNWYNANIVNAREYEEDLGSAYVMGTAELTDRLTLRAGLRAEQTTARSQDFDPLSAQEVVAAGYAVNAATGRATTIAGLQYQYLTNDKVEREGSYTDLFPSASIKYSFDHDIDLIAGYSRTIQRPDVSLLAGVWSTALTDEGTVVTAPNPDLKPEYSDNISVRLVKYFEPVGLVAVNYYRNRISNGIVSRSFTAEEFGYEGTEYADATFESYTNRSDQEINVNGYELEFNHAMDYLPGALGGLSVRGSWLFSDPDVPQERVATQVRQFGVSWRQGPARLNLNSVWSNEKDRGQTGSIATPSGTITQSQPFIPYLEVNLSGSYTLIRKTRDNFVGLEAYFSANNLFGNHRGTWYSNDEVGLGSSGHHSQIDIYSGRKATFGFRARF
jgi:iron complex outermembrane receptor protein